MSDSNGWRIVGACIIPNVGGWMGSFFVAKNYETWYETLKKPSWNPPKYVFGPVWTALYSGMGYASFLVWRDGGGFHGDAALPLTLYASQLALNWAWTPIAFGCHSLKWGLADILMLTLTANATAITFYKVNKMAGMLMLPYLAWLGFASSLNYCLYKKNIGKDKE